MLSQSVTTHIVQHDSSKDNLRQCTHLGGPRTNSEIKHRFLKLIINLRDIVDVIKDLQLSLIARLFLVSNSTHKLLTNIPEGHAASAANWWGGVMGPVTIHAVSATRVLSGHDRCYEDNVCRFCWLNILSEVVTESGSPWRVSLQLRLCGLYCLLKLEWCQSAVSVVTEEGVHYQGCCWRRVSLSQFLTSCPHTWYSSSSHT